jgi:lipopolysaccharide transport system permease protein
MATLIGARSESVLRHLRLSTLLSNLWQHRDLIWQFTWRGIVGRYKGSFLGLLWSFVHPLVQLLIYTFVFGIVFQARWPDARNESLTEFALVLFCGIVAFNLFSECVGQAPTLVVGVPNYVKKVVFPLEILPVGALGAALFHTLIGLGILLAANLLLSGSLAWTLTLLPLVMLPLVFLTLGLSWLLAALGVFVRDIGQGLGLLLQVAFFTTPIFYPFEAVPESLRFLIRLNPLASVVENFRRVILWERLPSWPGLAAWTLAAGLVMLLGYAFFMKTKKAFADVV